MTVKNIGMGGSGKCDSTRGGISNVCAVFSYDVNGSKKPNTIGKDIFQFMMAVDGIYPNTGNNCRKNSDGYGCSSYIIKHNNMNYLH